MVHIQTRRAGLICIAAVVNDNLEISSTWGLTQEGARRRWHRREERRWTGDDDWSSDARLNGPETR